jgi:hypothetical protein
MDASTADKVSSSQRTDPVRSIVPSTPHPSNLCVTTQQGSLRFPVAL